jgi:hypothetical protein
MLSQSGVISWHCGNVHLYELNNIPEFSDLNQTLNVYSVENPHQSYGVQFLRCKDLSANRLMNHLDSLERYMFKEDERHRQHFMENLWAFLGLGKLPVRWIYVHLIGLPNTDVLAWLGGICRADTNDIFTRKYSNLAITMRLYCGPQEYHITIKSTMTGLEEGIKLNTIDPANLDVLKFQQNIVYIKQTHEIAAYFATLIERATDTTLTEDQKYQMLCETVLGYDNSCGSKDDPNLWETYLVLNGKEVFDFNKFQLKYDEWIVNFFRGNHVFLIGTIKSAKGYKKGASFMDSEARKYLTLRSTRTPILDSRLAELFKNKQYKHLPPMYLFLDMRKNRKPADVSALFAFNKAGADALSDSQWQIITYEVCTAVVDLKQNQLQLNYEHSRIFRVNSATSVLFELYVNVRTLLEHYDSIKVVTAVYNLLRPLECRNYIFGELTVKYGLPLAARFQAYKLDASGWSEATGRRIRLTVVVAALKGLQHSVSNILVAEKEIMVKEGKHRRRTLVKYTIGALRSDVNICMGAQYSVWGQVRVYKLAKDGSAHFKSKGLGDTNYLVSSVVREKMTLGKMIYVLLTDGTLRFCIEAQNPDTLASERLTHAQLASMAPVLDAGEMFLRWETGKWVVFKINNSSGHYQPRPTDGLQGVDHLLRDLLRDNDHFGIVSPRCSLENALSATRLSVVDGVDSVVCVDETTQVLGSNF